MLLRQLLFWLNHDVFDGSSRLCPTQQKQQYRDKDTRDQTKDDPDRVEDYGHAGRAFWRVEIGMREYGLFGGVAGRPVYSTGFVYGVESATDADRD